MTDWNKWAAEQAAKRSANGRTFSADEYRKMSPQQRNAAETAINKTKR